MKCAFVRIAECVKKSLKTKQNTSLTAHNFIHPTFAKDAKLLSMIETNINAEHEAYEE